LLLCQAGERFLSYIDEGMHQGNESAKEARGLEPAVKGTSAKGPVSRRRLGEDSKECDGGRERNRPPMR
jgi:hypothetical protein